MKPNSYAILNRAVEEGISQGWEKARKYSDEPSKDIIFNEIEHYIMLNISELFIFDEEPLDQL